MKTLLLATLLLTSMTAMAGRFHLNTKSWPLQATFKGMGLGFNKEVKIEEGERSALLGYKCELFFKSVSRKTMIKKDTVLKIKDITINEEGGAIIKFDHPRADILIIEGDYDSPLTWDNINSKRFISNGDGKTAGDYCDQFLYLDIAANVWAVKAFSPRGGAAGYIFKDLGVAVKFSKDMTWFYSGNITYLTEQEFYFDGREIKAGEKTRDALRYTEMKGPMRMGKWDGMVKISTPSQSYPYTSEEYVEYKDGEIHYDDFLF